jgi:hypothetical protein
MKLTHIITGRNDNYAGFFDDRLILTMKYNFHLYKRAGIDCEFIFVEWASDPNRPLLCEKLNKTFADVDFKGYVVDQDTHDQIVGTREWMTFLEFFAKNVGIRRAKNDYILCSNADIFLGKGVLSTLLENLDTNTVYRAERHDIEMTQLKALNDEQFSLATIKRHVFPPYDKVFVDGSGDFTAAHRKLWFKTGGHDENQRFVKIHKDSRFLFSAFEHGAKFKNLGTIYHIDHGTSVPMTGLSAQRYRHANGPYHWKYMHNLPYTNVDTWGLTGSNIEDEKLKDRIFRVKVKNLKDLTYPDDKEYFIPTAPMSDRYQW